MHYDIYLLCLSHKYLDYKEIMYLGIFVNKRVIYYILSTLEVRTYIFLNIDHSLFTFEFIISLHI